MLGIASTELEGDEDSILVVVDAVTSQPVMVLM